LYFINPLVKEQNRLFSTIEHCCRTPQLPVALFGPTLPFGKPGKYVSSASLVPAFTSAGLDRWAVSARRKCQATGLEMQPALVEREVAILTRAGDMNEHLLCFKAQWTMEGYHQKAN